MAKEKSGGMSNIVWVAAVLIAAGLGYAFWPGGGEDESQKSAGKDTASQVKTIPSRGVAHLRPKQTQAYPDSYPTSGPHAVDGTDPGFYGKPQPPTRLVHSLEHGNIVIHYDQPGDDVLNSLREWAVLYTNPWSGVIATPQPSIGKTVVLTAWTKRLTLPNFERPAAAAFIDLYRGRGPKKRVR